MNFVSETNADLVVRIVAMEIARKQGLHITPQMQRATSTAEGELRIRRVTSDEIAELKREVAAQARNVVDNTVLLATAER